MQSLRLGFSLPPNSALPPSLPPPHPTGSWVGRWSCCVVIGARLSQNLRVVPVPERAYGNFFEEHCYIVLHVSIRGVCLRGGLAQLGSVRKQTKLHPWQRQAGSPGIHPTRGLPPLRPLRPSLPILDLLSGRHLPSPTQGPAHPGSVSTPLPLTHTNTWALGSPEPEGRAGGAQRPALLGREGGRRAGAGRGGRLRAAPAGGAGRRRHRAAPGGAGPRVRLLPQLLPHGNHVSARRGSGRPGATPFSLLWGCGWGRGLS